MDELLGWSVMVVFFLAGWGTISHIGAANSGQHTGYVTAVEQQGLIWKTWRAYVKTDPMSSQEDSYCVMDPSIIRQLQDAETSRALITVDYASPHIVWKWECDGEGSIITSLENDALPTSGNETTNGNPLVTPQNPLGI
jgi:hypothetical protein